MDKETQHVPEEEEEETYASGRMRAMGSGASETRPPPRQAASEERGGGEGSDETDVAMTHANNATGVRMDPLLHAPPHTRTRERCARACHANMGRAHVRA